MYVHTYLLILKESGRKVCMYIKAQQLAAKKWCAVSSMRWETGVESSWDLSLDRLNEGGSRGVPSPA